MSPRRCDCSTPVPGIADGQTYCTTCGERLPDPRDKLLVLIARGLGGLERRLDAIEEKLDSAATETAFKLLSPEEVAELLGVHPAFVREHADELGVMRFGEGPKPRLYFNRRALDARLSSGSLGRRTSSPESRNGKPKRRVARKRRSGTRRDLLPVRGSGPG